MITLIPVKILISSPIEQFEVSHLLALSGPALGDLVLGLTNFVIYAGIVGTLVVGVHLLGDNDHRLIPTHWSTLIETLYASVNSFAYDQLGARHMNYYPFIYALFIVLVVTNLTGNVPYGFTLTSTAIMSMGLSLVIFVGVTLIGVLTHRVHFFAYFVPAGTPIYLVPLLTLIELISYLARAVSLGVRLAANMIAGHILIAILASFLYGLFGSGLLIATVTLIPFVIFTALMVLELAVSVIQSYVLTALTAGYIKDAYELH